MACLTWALVWRNVNKCIRLSASVEMGHYSVDTDGDTLTLTALPIREIMDN